MRVWFGLGLLAGCTFGGGPTIGLRLDHRHARRVVLGGEANAGIAIFQLSAGFAGGYGFGRLDLAVDPIVQGSNHETSGIAARVGVGIGGDAEGASGTFVGGLGGERAFGETTSCTETHPFGVVTVDLRYIRGWQLVLAPRIEGFKDICSH